MKFLPPPPWLRDHLQGMLAISYLRLPTGFYHTRMKIPSVYPYRDLVLSQIHPLYSGKSYHHSAYCNLCIGSLFHNDLPGREVTPNYPGVFALASVPSSLDMIYM